MNTSNPNPNVSYVVEADIHNKSKYVIVFDYDDTLLPSSYLQLCGYNLNTTQITLELLYKLQILELIIIKLITNIIHLIGKENIVIITNAEQNWIELSSQKFIPNEV